MFRKIMAVLLATGAIAGLLSAHDAREGKADTYIKEARVVAVVTVREVKVVDQNCSVTTVVTVTVKRLLKGSLPAGEKLNYQYTDHIWKKGCPSVHYTYGPRAYPMVKDKEIIVTAGTGFPGWKGWWITSSYNLDQLERVKKLL